MRRVLVPPPSWPETECCTELEARRSKRRECDEDGESKVPDGPTSAARYKIVGAEADAQPGEQLEASVQTQA